VGAIDSLFLFAMRHKPWWGASAIYAPAVQAMMWRLSRSLGKF